MDAIELLESDHRRAEKIFGLLEYADKTKRAAVFEVLNQELSKHAAAEETVFYPTLAEFDSTRGDVNHAFLEHSNVKNTLRAMSILPADGDKFMELAKELKASVEHHVKEEEAGMFKDAREKLSKADLENMVADLNAAKASLDD